MLFALVFKDFLIISAAAKLAIFAHLLSPFVISSATGISKYLLLC